MLHHKKILAAGTPAEIKTTPDEYLQAFINASLVGRSSLAEGS
jgi:hypothetical protein